MMSIRDFTAGWLTGMLSGLLLGYGIFFIAPLAHADDNCMPYLWYSACHDTTTDKWQLCNFGNDGLCQPVPAPLQPSPFDLIR